MRHNEYELIIKRKLESVIQAREKVYVFPFGRLGKVVVQLCEEAGMDVIPLDNNNENLTSINEFNPNSEDLLIVASNSEEYYESIRNDVQKFALGKCKIMDLFPENQVDTWQDDSNREAFFLKHYDVKMYLPLYTVDYIQDFIYKYGVYFDEVNLTCIKELIENNYKGNFGGVALDIGANIGNHSLYMAKELGIKKIIAFEPAKSTFDILCKNIQLNNCEEIIYPYNLGVSNKKGKAVLASYDQNNLGMTQIAEDENGNISTISIDEMEVENVALIKIDTEGFELPVIEGALETIKKYLPYIYVEIKKEFNTIYKHLSSIGYSYIQLTKEDYLFYIG